MNIKDIPIANVVIIGVLLITGISVVAVVIGSIFGHTVDADTRGIIGNFVVALLGLLAGQRDGIAREQARQLNAMGQ